MTPELKVLETIMKRLDQQLPDPLAIRPSNVLGHLSECTGLPIATICYQEMQREMLQAQITSFRALMIYPMTDEEQAWPLVQWSEKGGRRSLTIFAMESDASGECSWLLHRSEGKGQTTLVWKVSGMSTLKTLFQAAQHLSGIMEIPKQDALKLYGGQNYEDFSPEEYPNQTLGCN